MAYSVVGITPSGRYKYRLHSGILDYSGANQIAVRYCSVDREIQNFVPHDSNRDIRKVVGTFEVWTDEDAAGLPTAYLGANRTYCGGIGRNQY